MSAGANINLVDIGKHCTLLGPGAKASEEMKRLAGESGSVVQTILDKYAEAQAVLETASDPNGASPKTLERVFDCFEDAWNELMDVSEVERESVFWKVVELDYHSKVIRTFERALESLDKTAKIFKRLRKSVHESAQKTKGQSQETLLSWEMSLQTEATRPGGLPRPTAVIQGLQSEPALNGREVEVLDLKPPNPTQQRVDVRLKKGSDEGRVISVKLERLVFPPSTGVHDLLTYKYRCLLCELDAAERTEKVELLLRDVRPAFASCRGLLLFCPFPDGDTVGSAASDANVLLKLAEDYARALQATAESIVECFGCGLGKAALYPRSPKPTNHELQHRRKHLQLVFHPDKLRQLGVPPFDQTELPEVFVQVQNILELVFSGPCTTHSDYIASMSRGNEFAENAESLARTQKGRDFLSAHAGEQQQVSYAKRALQEFRNAMLSVDLLARDGDNSQATSIARARVRVRIAEMCKLQNLHMQAQLYLLAASRVLRVHVDMSTTEGQEAMAAIQKASGLLEQAPASSEGPGDQQMPRDQHTQTVSCLPNRAVAASECFVSSMQLQELTSQLEGQALVACLSPMRMVANRANAETEAVNRQKEKTFAVGCSAAIAGVFTAKAAAAGAVVVASLDGSAAGVTTVAAAVPALWPVAAFMGVGSVALFVRSAFLEKERRGRERAREALTQRLFVAMMEHEAGHGGAGQILLESLATPLEEKGLSGTCILTYPVEHDIIAGVDNSLNLLLGHGVPPSSVMCIFTCVAEVLASYQLSTMTIDNRTIIPSHSDMRQAGKKLYRALIREACEEEEKVGKVWKRAQEFDAMIENDEKLSMADKDVRLTVQKAEFPLIKQFVHESKFLPAYRRLQVSVTPPPEVMKYNPSLSPKHFQRRRFVKSIKGGSNKHDFESLSTMDDLLGLLSEWETVELVLRGLRTDTRAQLVEAVARTIFGVYSPVTSEGAEMLSVRRQRWLARLGLGVVLLTEAASLGDGRNAGEVQEAEGELRRAITELKAFSDGQDEELEAKLEAVEDFFAALVGRPLAIEDQQTPSKLVAVEMTGTGSHCASEQIFEFWSGSDLPSTLSLALQFSGLPQQCFTRDAFDKAVEQHRSSPSYGKFIGSESNTVAPGAHVPAHSPKGGGGAPLNTCEALFLIEVLNKSTEVWFWELDADGALQRCECDDPPHCEADATKVHLYIQSGRSPFAMKLLGAGSVGAAHLLANLKSGAYGHLQVSRQFLARLRACADYCASARLTGAETMLAWEAREVGWLQCVVGFLKLGRCEHDDSAPVFSLLRRLAEHNQHSVIVGDILSDHTFMLRFGSQHTSKLMLWSSYSQLCLGQGHSAMAKAKCALISEQLESHSGTLEAKDWCQRIAAVCDQQLLPLASSRSRDVKHVLSIDGGGIRGILPARLLVEVEARVHRPIARLFPVMAGTSTGAIIAAGLAVPQGKLPKFSADKILAAYKGSGVFQSRRHPPVPSLYNEAPLCDLLQSLLDGALYQDLLCEVVVPAVRDEQEEVHVFSRANAAAVHPELKVFDVVRASTAAPAFFPAHTFSLGGKEVCFLDGALKANNPSQIALSVAQQTFPNAVVSVLSLGTGTYGMQPQLSRSALWWGFSPSSTGVMATLCSTDANVHRDMLMRSKKEKLEYTRWNPTLSCSMDFADDSQASVQDLLAIGDASIEQAYAAEDNWFNKLLESLAGSECE